MTIGASAIGSTSVGGANQASAANITIALTGTPITVSTGFVGAQVEADVFVSLTGQSVSVLMGSLGSTLGAGSDVNVQLTGSVITTVTGRISPRRFGRSGNVIIVPDV